MRSLSARSTIYFLQAQHLPQGICNDFMRVFRVPNLMRLAAPNYPSVDVLLHPSVIRTAPHLDEQAGLDVYTQDVLTCLPPLRVSRR